MDEKQVLKVKKVTPSALRVYKKHGLLELDNDDQLGKNMISVFLEDEKLKEIYLVTFEKEVPENVSEADLAMIVEGIHRFLAQLSGSLLKSLK